MKEDFFNFYLLVEEFSISQTLVLPEGFNLFDMEGQCSRTLANQDFWILSGITSWYRYYMGCSGGKLLDQLFVNKETVSGDLVNKWQPCLQWPWVDFKIPKKEMKESMKAEILDSRRTFLACSEMLMGSCARQLWTAKEIRKGGKS